MAASTIASGNYLTGACWSAGIIPAVNEEVAINATHAITVTTTEICGNSTTGADNTNYSLDIAATGKLIIDGGWLRVRGHWRVQNTSNQTTNLDAITVTNQGRLSFDATQAADTTTARYRCLWGTNLFCYRYLTLSNNSILDSVSGAACGWISPNNGLPFVSSGYSIVRRIGDATNRAMTIAYQSNANSRWQVQDTWFDQTGGVGLSSSVGALVLWTMTRVTFTGTTASQAFRMQGGSTSQAIIDCAFDKPAQLDGCNSPLVRPLFLGGLVRSGVYTSSTAEDAFMVAASGAPEVAASSLREYRTQLRAVNNGKIFQVANTCTTDALVIEPLGATSTDGEYFAGSAQNGTHTRPLLIPYHNGNSTRMIEILNDTSSIQTVVHGTVGAYLASVGFGHSGHTTANNGVERARVRHTLFVNHALSGTGATNSMKVALIPSGPTPTGNYVGTEFYDNASGGTGGAANMGAGSQGHGYDIAPSTGTPGAGDVDGVDPLFVGAPGGGLARIETWARDEFGMGGTIADREDAMLAALGVQQLSANRYEVSAHAAYVAGVSQVALHEWVRAKWAPTNIALKTNVSGDNNGWIGAVEGIESPTGEIAIAVTPEHRWIVRGATGSFTVTLTRTDYTAPVTILATGLPTGVTASYPDGNEYTGGDTELTVLLTVAADAPLVDNDVWSVVASGGDVGDAIEILTVTVLDVPPTPTLMTQRPSVSFPRATSPAVRFTV